MKEKIVANGVHNYTAPEEYQPPRSPQVQEHLDWFMGLKLGFMMHWAPGSQLGTYESWPLSDGDADWSQEDFTWADPEVCKQAVLGSEPRTFNPGQVRRGLFGLSWPKTAVSNNLLFTTQTP